MTGPCDSCGHCDYLDKCHIQSRGAGGGDQDWNLISMCRSCHIAQHRHGWKSFSEKFPSVQKVLQDKGFTFQELFGRVRLVRDDSGESN